MLPEFDDDGVPQYVTIVKACLALHPADRPAAAKVVAMLLDLCEEKDCGVARCPDYTFDPEGYRDAAPSA